MKPSILTWHPTGTNHSHAGDFEPDNPTVTASAELSLLLRLALTALKYVVLTAGIHHRFIVGQAPAAKHTRGTPCGTPVLNGLASRARGKC